MVLNVDAPATFLALAGVPIPEHYQGRSLLPILQGGTAADWPVLKAGEIADLAAFLMSLSAGR